MAEDVDMNEELVKYLKDAHGMEQHSLTTLRAAVKVPGDPQLKSLYEGHVVETQRHLELIEERLESHGESRSLLKDISGRVGALGMGVGLVAQPDTPAKLLAVAYGFEHVEIASYELLRRVAEQAGDADTVNAVDKILVNERQAAEKLGASYDLALERALHGKVKSK